MTAPEKNGYRPDVDGLRAVAVLLVIAYHFNPAFLPGGYVGVDVFFVISGYVVTRSVLHAETSRWTADVLGFWKRRFLRIFPALVTFVALTAIVGAMLLPPFPEAHYEGSFRTGVAAVAGLANIYLHRLDLDYFQDPQNNLFLHTWSLGVEEQFYLAFSLLFIALPRMLRANRWRLAGMGLVALASFALFLFEAGRDPTRTYYFLPYRLWELAIGSVLAMVPVGLLWARRPWLTAPLQGAGLAALAIAAMTPAPEGVFPVLQITLSVLAAAALIATGERLGRPAPVSSVLATRPLVTVGLISYSLYLWHWPVLIFFRSTVGLQSVPAAVGALAVMFALAAASYVFVEKPWRVRGRRFRDALPYTAAMAAVVVGVIAMTQFAPGAAYVGARQDWMGDWRRPDAYAYGAAGRVMVSDCYRADGAAVPADIPPACVSLPSQGQAPLILLIGDSQASALWEMVAEGSNSGAFDFATMVHGGCSMQDQASAQTPSCRRYWDLVPHYIKGVVSPGDVVFLAIAWSPLGATDDAGPARLMAIGEAVRRAGGKLVVQTRLPVFGRATWLCTPEWFRTDYDRCIADRASFEKDKQPVTAFLGRQSIGVPIHVWDPSPLLCDARECRQFQGHHPVFRDYIHLSSYGARYLAPAFSEFIARLPEPSASVPAGSGG